jgi:hypothetical protein
VETLEDIMHKLNTKFVCQALKLTFSLFCCGLFFYFSLDIWDKFSHKFTTTGVRFVDHELQAKQLPCITLCSWESFKKKAEYYNFTDFLTNTFGQDEIIKDKFEDEQLTQFETLNSMYYGRCYMICHSKNISINESFSLTLLKTNDIKGSCNRDLKATS